ncbi:MAG: RNA 2',3'-cyclic phosphodiesterase [Methanobacteriota archaeon]
MVYRAFIAVEVGGMSRLLDMDEELKRTHGDLKIVDADNIHMTMKFLGNVDEAAGEKIVKAMKAAVKKFEPFDMVVRGVGVFPSEDDIKIIWVGVDDPKPLAKIYDNLEKSLKKLGYEPESRAFTPHVTIARVRSPKNRLRVKEIVDAHKEDEFGVIKVDTLFLKKSFLTNEGPVYTTVGTARLGE